MAMGLDSVELLIALEDEFGIAIPDEAAQELVTPRLVTDYFLGQLQQTEASECLRQQTFFRLRRGLRGEGHEQRDSVRPATRLDELIAHEEWPRTWRRLRESADLGHWPEQAPWQGRSQFRGKTVRELVHELAAADPRGEPDYDAGWTREQVSLRVRRCIAGVIGGRLFDEDAHFVNDLGIH
ncbi:MAG: hypothetical protein NXI31_14405 [bacterium]|nr:hypothetical protein [bacterium]